MMDVNKTYCGNHFRIYDVKQTFMLNTLNLYSAINQLYFNKNREKLKYDK